MTPLSGGDGPKFVAGFDGTRDAAAGPTNAVAVFDAAAASSIPSSPHTALDTTFLDETPFPPATPEAVRASSNEDDDYNSLPDRLERLDPALGGHEDVYSSSESSACSSDSEADDDEDMDIDEGHGVWGVYDDGDRAPLLPRQPAGAVEPMSAFIAAPVLEAALQALAHDSEAVDDEVDGHVLWTEDLLAVDPLAAFSQLNAPLPLQVEVRLLRQRVLAHEVARAFDIFDNADLFSLNGEFYAVL